MTTMFHCLHLASRSLVEKTKESIMQMTTVANEDIVSIVHSIFEVMLNLPAEPAELGVVQDDGSSWAGSIRIGGAWTGVVEIQITSELARQIAAQMLAMDAADVLENDLQDAVAELTNMIGGNIKSQVPGPSQLSLPCVARVPEGAGLAGHQLINDIAICSNGEPLRVSVWEATAA